MTVNKETLGLVHVYTGMGKGKTTAALGQAMRAIGHDLKIYMVQFMKMGYSGEVIVSRKNNVDFEVAPFNVKCINDTEHQLQISKGIFQGYCRECFTPNEFDREKSIEAFEYAKAAACSGIYNIVILDEINVVLGKGLLETWKIIELIEKKYKNTELILTGRNAPKEIINKADYVTEMRLIKHPMYKGIPARKGIEF